MSTDDELPPCGIYRTTEALDEHVPAGRLVYFHNHGDPGPGVYLPASWSLNRADWHERGHTVPSPDWVRSLVPLPEEGLYRVREEFTCCAEACRTYEENLLVQLGYDTEANAILFVPEWSAQGLAIPELGTHIDADRLARLELLHVAESDDEPDDTVH